MPIKSRIIMIKPEKTQEYLNLKPNSDAIDKAKKTMEKYGHNVKRNYGRRTK